MDNRKSNKNSASEDELGEIHSMTTKLHSARLKYMLELIAKGADVEAVIGDGKAMLAAGKWAADQNNITCAQPEMNEESELSKRLAAIKAAQKDKGARPEGNVIPFNDEEEYG